VEPLSERASPLGSRLLRQEQFVEQRIVLVAGFGISRVSQRFDFIIKGHRQGDGIELARRRCGSRF